MSDPFIYLFVKLIYGALIFFVKINNEYIFFYSIGHHFILSKGMFNYVWKL